jgi:hypothetical protein
VKGIGMSTTINMGKLVPSARKRVEFLLRYFGEPNEWTEFERTVSYFFKKLCLDYSDACWDFIDIPSGCYVRPVIFCDQPDKRIWLAADNEARELVSLDAAGITVTLYALNTMIAKRFDPQALEDDPYMVRMFNLQEALTDFMKQHPEVRQINRLLD